MRAWRLFGRDDFRLVEVEAPVPAYGEVSIQVHASGLCQSDVMITRMPPGLALGALPLTLGHEFAGTIAAVGPGVRGIDEGDRVVIYNTPGCGRCDPCARGSEQDCVEGRHTPGVQRDGGLADYAVVDARSVVPIGDLDFTQAAPLADAGKTAYQSVRLGRDSVRPGGTSVVVGVGGLGHAAVQFLGLLGSRVVAVDVHDDKLELARRCGAVATVRSDDADGTGDLVQRVLATTGGLVDAAFDFVGVDETVALTTSVVRVGGAAVVTGTGGGSVPFGYGHAARRGVAWRLSGSGTQGDLRDVVALARAGRLSMHVERFDFDAADDVLARLDAGSVTGRAVVHP